MKKHGFLPDDWDDTPIHELPSWDMPGLRRIAPQPERYEKHVSNGVHCAICVPSLGVGVRHERVSVR
jgi:hypothetical protein